MPKLPTAAARRVNKADTSGGRSNVDPGQYLATLRKCVVAPKKDKNGNEYWLWTFEIDEAVPSGDTQFKGAKQTYNTGLSEDQDWKMKTAFEAFEAKPNADTDTLIGHQVLLDIDEGEYQGKPRSEITGMHPASEAEAPVEDEEEEDEAGDDEDDF